MIFSDFLYSLRASGISIDDKEKIEALKFYISKAGNAKLRSLTIKSQTSLEYIALRDQNIIPHTVFLAPNDQSLEVCDVKYVIPANFSFAPSIYISNCKDMPPSSP